jgi:DNA-directed RNA polymerase III subunit Rpc31
MVALQFFPKELWHTIDPKRKHPLWRTVDGPLAGARPQKRKRPIPANTEQGHAQNEEEHNSDEDSDVVVTGRRKHNAAKSRKTDPTTKSATQKQGLDAEDDYPDADPDNDDDGDVEDQPQDSEFDESDVDNDDYNAEQYFDAGDDDDFGIDEGGGDEDAWM